MPFYDPIPDGGDPSGNPAYAGIYALVGTYLGKPETFWTPTPDPLLVQVVGAQIPIWLRKMPCITSGSYDYADISGDDLPFFDNGVAIIATDILRAGLMANSNEGRGPVVEERAGSVSEKFAEGSSSVTSLAIQSASESAQRAAWAQFGLMECVQSAQSSAPRFSSFGTAGRSRSCGCRKVGFY